MDTSIVVAIIAALISLISIIVTIWRSVFEKSTREKVLNVESRIKQSDAIRIKALCAAEEISECLSDLWFYSESALSTLKHNGGVWDNRFKNELEDGTSTTRKLAKSLRKNAMYLPPEVVESIDAIGACDLEINDGPNIDNKIVQLLTRNRDSARALNRTIAKIFRDTYINLT